MGRPVDRGYKFAISYNSSASRLRFAASDLADLVDRPVKKPRAIRHLQAHNNTNHVGRCYPVPIQSIQAPCGSVQATGSPFTANKNGPRRAGVASLAAISGNTFAASLLIQVAFISRIMRAKPARASTSAT